MLPVAAAHTRRLIPRAGTRKALGLAATPLYAWPLLILSVWPTAYLSVLTRLRFVQSIDTELSWLILSGLFCVSPADRSVSFRCWRPQPRDPSLTPCRTSPPVTLASWRAQTTTLLLVLPGIYQLSQLDSGEACLYVTACKDRAAAMLSPSCTANDKRHAACQTAVEMGSVHA